MLIFLLAYMNFNKKYCTKHDRYDIIKLSIFHIKPFLMRKMNMKQQRCLTQKAWSDPVRTAPAPPHFVAGIMKIYFG